MKAFLSNNIDGYLMKRFLIFFSVLAFFLMPVNSPGAGKKITLVTGEWEPYTGENMERKGFVTEIVTAVFKEMGLETQYSFFPWKRCESVLENGEAFAAFPYVKTADREKIFDFSDVVANTTGRFFYLKSNIKQKVSWKTLADLKTYKVGGTLGYWYEKDFKEAGLNVYYAGSDENNLKHLYSGTIDIVAMDELMGWHYITKLYPKEVNRFDTLNKPLNDMPLYLMISKKYPNSAELKIKFNKALIKIKKNGVLAAILKKYNLK
jgi:polar amino acid transport system substrate-binding protein